MKIAVITGASTGIGRATGLAFADQGYRVFNIARRGANSKLITDIGCDLSCGISLQSSLQQLREAIAGATQVSLVHNACQMLKDDVASVDPEALAKNLQINIVAPTQLNAALIPLMAPGSSVIYIGSTLSEKAVANSFSYVTSKHASVGMMRASTQDLVGKGIHSCCICPGFTDTDMLRTHIGNNSDIMHSLAAMNSFSRMIEPEEIADLVVWAHINPVINGSVLHAHLGQIEH